MKHIRLGTVISVVLLAAGGTASAADCKATIRPAPTREEARETDEANRSFLGVKFNPAFGAVTIPGRVEEAKIVGTGDDARVVVTQAPESRVAALFEVHRLVDIKARARKERMEVDGRCVNTEEVRAAVGPFATIQSSETSAIDAFGIGVMLGFRSGETSAFNLGLGAMLDPNAKFLPTGFVDGAAPPKGASDVQLTTRSKWGWVLLASFTF